MKIGLNRFKLPKLTSILTSVVLGTGLFAVLTIFVIAPQTPHAQEHKGHSHDQNSLYQCPMHAQITADGEGRCPLCNMFFQKRPKAKVLEKRKAWEKKTGKTAPKTIHIDPKVAAATQPSTKTAKMDHSKMGGKMDPSKMPKKTGPSTKMGTTSKNATAAATGETDGIDYTCPMHEHVSKNSNEELRCPVCGMNLVPRDQIKSHEGHDHKHSVFSCPMHPNVVRDEAGRCPICGMDLQQAERDTLEKKKEKAAKGERKILHWQAPMDPTFISDKPGKSPMGMDLVPVYEDNGEGRSLIKIDPVVVQNMGVRIARAKRQPLFRHIRTLGTVDVAENEISVVNLRFSGWIEKLYVDETGVKVERGQAMAEIYSPELISAQEEYLLALRTGGIDSRLAKSARRRLAFFGLAQSDIKRVETKMEALRTIRIRAPQSGYVLHKAVVKGARVMAGKDLYRIGNLQNIWINAEVYEFDAPWVVEGAPAVMELSFQKGKVYSGKVAYIYPTLDNKSRTLTVRLEFENPGLQLRPGMFATVRIEARKREGAIAIPTEAILHSGERELVFVALGNGRYDKRDVITGLVADRYLTEIIEGIQEGERIVVSGQFLLDSESQLQEAVQKLLESRLEHKDPGASVGGKKSGKASPAGDAYFTCSMHPQIVQEEAGTCPICGMNLVKRKR